MKLTKEQEANLMENLELFKRSNKAQRQYVIKCWLECDKKGMNVHLIDMDEYNKLAEVKSE